jgi:hypothetical protein
VSKAVAEAGRAIRGWVVKGVRSLARASTASAPAFEPGQGSGSGSGSGKGGDESEDEETGVSVDEGYVCSVFPLPLSFLFLFWLVRSKSTFRPSFGIYLSFFHLT